MILNSAIVGIFRNAPKIAIKAKAYEKPGMRSKLTLSFPRMLRLSLKILQPECLEYGSCGLCRLFVIHHVR